MITSRSVGLILDDLVSEMSDRDLRMAIAREVFGWESVRETRNGRIIGQPPRGAPIMDGLLVAPDWLNNVTQLARLEWIAKAKFGGIVCQKELGRVAGDFNEHPTPRQRCEAVLLAARRAVDDLLR